MSKENHFVLWHLACIGQSEQLHPQHEFLFFIRLIIIIIMTDNRIDPIIIVGMFSLNVLNKTDFLYCCFTFVKNNILTTKTMIMAEHKPPIIEPLPFIRDPI